VAALHTRPVEPVDIFVNREASLLIVEHVWIIDEHGRREFAAILGLANFSQEGFVVCPQDLTHSIRSSY
jgi:hypothetical protein